MGSLGTSALVSGSAFISEIALFVNDVSLINGGGFGNPDSTEGSCRIISVPSLVYSGKFGRENFSDSIAFSSGLKSGKISGSLFSPG
ncbi:MAG: hypothetical protein MJ235_08330 [archaeon]|nr:hypothetical protein [archaeon]